MNIKPSEQTSIRQPPGFVVVLDANVWITERMLQTTVGTALLFTITTNDSTIGLPEVVEIEVNHVLSAQAEQAVETIRRGATLLRQLSGQRASHQVPTQEAILKGIGKRWTALEGVLQRIAFTHEHAKSALTRIVAKTPPCGENNEQFRDACIWAATLEMARHKPTYLITNDGAFFEGRDRNRASLAQALQHEVLQASIEIAVFPSVGRFLESIASRVEKLDETALRGTVLNAIRGTAAEIVQRDAPSFNIMGESLPHISGYATPKPSAIAISFDAQFDLERVAMRRKNEARIAAFYMHGTCSYDPKTDTVAEVEIESWGTRMKEAGSGFRSWHRPGSFELDFLSNTRFIE